MKIEVASVLTGVLVHRSQEEKIAVRKLLFVEVQHITCVICLVDSWRSLNGLVRIFNAASKYYWLYHDEDKDAECDIFLTHICSKNKYKKNV